MRDRRSKILFDARREPGGGIGRYSYEIRTRLSAYQPFYQGWSPTSPLDPLRTNWWLRGKANGAEKPSVFYSPGPNGPLPYRLSVPYCVTLHDLMFLDVPKETTRYKKLYFRSVTRLIAENARVIFTVSRFSRERLLDWLDVPAERVIVAPNGVSREFVPDGAQGRRGVLRPYFLYVGNRRPHKNVVRLMNAFGLLKARYELDIQLVMTGQIDKWLVDTIDQAGLKTSDVALLGENVTDRELAELYRGAEATVCPSLYEGFGLPALEAMACGCPVVVSSVTALPEVVGDAGFFVDPWNVESIAAGLLRSLTNSEARTRAIALGFRQARGFEWEQTTRVIEDAVEEVA